MASSWGTSWGTSWGDSWGVVNDGAITGALFVDPDTFGAAVIGRGAVNIDGAIYSDADTFGASTVSASYTVIGATYSDPDTFGAATVAAGAYTITGVLYADADTFGAHTVTPGARNILAAWFIDPDSFGTSTVFTPAIEFVSPGHERCMRCGSIKGRSRLRKEWTGLLVCEDTCWEPRHPQMTLRGVPDNQTLPWTRPEPTPVFLTPNQVQASDL